MKIFYNYVSRFIFHIFLLMVCLLGIIWVCSGMCKDFLEFIIHFYVFMAFFVFLNMVFMVLLLGTTWTCAAMFLGKEFTQMSS
jgi:hypothetical protein